MCAIPTSRSTARLLLAALLLLSASISTPAESLTPKARDRAIAVGVRAAMSARADGQFKRAFGQLTSLVSRFPKSARAHHELGVLYAVHGQFGLAATQLRQALRLNSGLTAARRGLAEVLRADGQCDAAIAHYAALLRTKSQTAGSGTTSRQRARALRGLALCREATGDTAGSRAALQQLIREHDGSDTGRWATGYLRAMAKSPAGVISAATAEREGLRHFRVKRYAEAAAWFELACRRGPSADRCYRLGIARLGERSFLAAAMAFRRALHLNAKHLPTLSAWPTAARKLRQQARGGLNADFAHVSGTRPALRVAAALRADDLLLAEQLATAALKASHPGRAVRLLRAETRLRRGQITAAETDLRLLLRAKPDLVVARHGLAVVAMRRGQKALARRFAGLSALTLPPPGVQWPASARPDADLDGFFMWRRAAMDHLLRRMGDAGLKPYPAYVAPTPLNPESIRSTAPAPPAPHRRR